MKTPARKSNAETLIPAVHLEFIQNQLENPNGSESEDVAHFQRSLFLHQHAVELEKHRQQARTHEDQLAFLERQLKATDMELGARSKFVPATMDGQEDNKPSLPWNAWDLLMFGAGCLGIICLITFGVWNISFNLLESGLITFRENPVRSYLWAALLPVGALAVKIGWDFLQDRKKRDTYLWSCLALGMAGVLVWVAAYASVYPTLSKGINEHIAALTVIDSPARSGTGLNFAGAKWIDATTVAAQAVAEIFLSAAIGIYLTGLYARHRPVRMAHDPAYAQLIQHRGDLEQSIARERLDLGVATGNVLRLESQLAALIAFGKSLLHRETARRQDESEKRQVILDQLSDHLRHHLQAVGAGNRLVANGPSSAADRSNGD